MTAISTYIDSISRRVRDEANTANTRDLIRDLFTRAASVINTRQEYLLDTVTVTSGTAGKKLYTVETEIGSFAKVTDVKIAEESLNHVNPWRNLWKLSNTWLTDTSAAPLAWSTIGRDLVAIWPAPLSDVTITFSGLRGDFQTSSELEETGMRDEDNDIVRELTVALVLLRQLDLDMIRPSIGRMAGKMNIQAEEIEELMRLG